MAFDRKKPVRSRPSRSIGLCPTKRDKRTSRRNRDILAPVAAPHSHLSLSHSFSLSLFPFKQNEYRGNGGAVDATDTYTCCRREYGPGEKFTKRGSLSRQKTTSIHGDQILFSLEHYFLHFRGMKAAAKPSRPDLSRAKTFK